ncbi:protein MANBAL isoform X1 [Lampetra planeri]
MVLLFISSPASLSFPLLFAITEKSLPTITTTSSSYYADGDPRGCYQSRAFDNLREILRGLPGARRPGSKSGGLWHEARGKDPPGSLRGTVGASAVRGRIQTNPGDLAEHHKGYRSIPSTQPAQHLEQSSLPQLPFTAVTMATIGELLAPDVPELSLFERLLNHGLFLGAVFQLLCILAVVMLPDKAAATAAAEQGHASPGSSTPAEAEPPRASRHLQGKKLKKESKKKK